MTTPVTRDHRLTFFVLFGGAAAWVAQLGIGYVMVGVACTDQSRALYLIVGVVAGIVALASGVAAFLHWRHRDVERIDTAPTTGGFLAMAGLVLNVAFLTMIVWTTILGTYVNPCPFLSMPLP